MVRCLNERKILYETLVLCRIADNVLMATTAWYIPLYADGQPRSQATLVDHRPIGDLRMTSLGGSKDVIE